MRWISLALLFACPWAFAETVLHDPPRAKACWQIVEMLLKETSWNSPPSALRRLSYLETPLFSSKGEKLGIQFSDWISGGDQFHLVEWFPQAARGRLLIRYYDEDRRRTEKNLVSLNSRTCAIEDFYSIFSMKSEPKIDSLERRDGECRLTSEIAAEDPARSLEFCKRIKSANRDQPRDEARPPARTTEAQPE